MWNINQNTKTKIMIDSREYQEEEKENECGYCGEPCEKEFCNRECGKAYDQDNFDE